MSKCIFPATVAKGQKIFINLIPDIIYMTNPVTNAAIRITLRFTQVEDLPERFTRKKEDLLINFKKDTVAERRFQFEIKEWERFINYLLVYESTDLLWRFLSTNPLVEPGINSVSKCSDFINLTDLFIQIRDKNQIPPEIIGKYSQLLSAFQKEIESKLISK